MEFYPWVVLAHVLLVILAFGAHGVSAFVMFRVRAEADRAKLTALLDLSESSLLIGGLGLLAAALLGVAAAIMGSHFSKLWPWASIALFVVVLLAMTPMAGIPMGRVRQALGMKTRNDKKGDPPREPASDAELATVRAALRPELVLAVGVAGIVLLSWMMAMKPF